MFSVESTTPGRYVQFVVSFDQESKGIHVTFFEKGRHASIHVGLSPDQWSVVEFMAWRRVRAVLPNDFCFVERLRSEILLPV
jgi:hypothetical protein